MKLSKRLVFYMQVGHTFQKSENGYRNVTSCKGTDYEESQKNNAENLKVKAGSFCKS